MRIDRFEVTDQLGRDGSSVIYRAQDPNLRRDVTIRVLDAARSPQALSQFQKSAQALARLRHVGIVGVHDLGVTQGCPYLVMDHVPGQSLVERVERRGPLPAKDAAEALRAVSEALGYAHRQGVLHRDVRPERVLLTAAGEALIGDFSLALGVEEASAPGLAASSSDGRRGFLAPEQVEGRLGAVGPATDVYGVGATLYYALTGQPPFGEDLPADRRPPLRPASGIAAQVPRGLDQVCATALQADPEARYPSPSELAEDLSRFLSGRAISRSRSWSRVLPVHAGAKPLVFVGVVVLAGTTIGLGAAAFTQPATPAVAEAPLDPGAAAGADTPARDAIRVSFVRKRGFAKQLNAVTELVAERRYPAALEQLDAILAAEPEHTLALAWRAYAHAALDRHELALDDAARALRHDPTCAKALEARVLTLTTTARYPEALADATRWLEVEPENADAHAARAGVFGRWGRYEQALESVEAALRLDPTKARYYINRGVCRVSLGDPEGALRDMNQAVELFQRPHEQPFSTRGMVHRQLGDKEAALADFRRGVELQPDEAFNWNALAAGLLETEAPGALEALNKAIQLDPGYFDALTNRAMLYRRQGRPQEAKQDLLRALEVAPDADRDRVRRILADLERTGR